MFRLHERGFRAALTWWVDLDLNAEGVASSISSRYRQTAACFSVIPSSIARTNASRPASPSLALAYEYFHALLRA